MEESDVREESAYWFEASTKEKKRKIPKPHGENHARQLEQPHTDGGT